MRRNDSRDDSRRSLSSADGREEEEAEAGRGGDRGEMLPPLAVYCCQASLPARFLLLLALPPPPHLRLPVLRCQRQRQRDGASSVQSRFLPHHLPDLFPASRRRSRFLLPLVVQHQHHLVLAPLAVCVYEPAVHEELAAAAMAVEEMGGLPGCSQLVRMRVGVGGGGDGRVEGVDGRQGGAVVGQVPARDQRQLEGGGRRRGR